MAILLTYESEVEMIEIDGSYGEGGGQILRTALAFSAILKIPIRVKNIRASRKNPGLGNQHLAAVNALARISGATIEGNKIGSQTLTFIPQEIRPGDYEFKIETAGSVTLLLQAIFLPLSLASLKLIFERLDPFQEIHIKMAE